MPTFKRFEDILAWQKARELTHLVYELTRNADFSKDFGLKDQIRRASVSIMANIAEGFARRSDKDFAHFLNIARGSAAEVQCHLYVALDQNYVLKSEFEKIYGEAGEVSKMIYSLAKHLAK